MDEYIATPTAEQLETQSALVRSVVEDRADLRDGEWGERGWVRLVVDYEAKWNSEAPVTSALSFAVAENPDGSLEKLSFRLSAATKLQFTRLAVQMKEQQGTFWTVCHLVIDRTGRHSFDFSYDPPYRLSGALNDTRFVDYIAQHLAELKNLRP